MHRSVASTRHGHFRRLALLVVAVSINLATLGLVSLGGTPAVAHAASIQCAPSIFVGVRGSSESDQSYESVGQTVGRTYDRYREFLLPTRTTALFPLSYFSLGTGAIAGGWYVDLSWKVRNDYLDSINNGVDTLKTVLKAIVARCNSWIVLTGYSQGALVIRRALVGVPANIVDRIAGIALFGDPARVDSGDGLAPYGTAHGGGTNGIWDAIVGRVPAVPPTRGFHGSWCLHGDGVCGFTPNALLTSQVLGDDGPHGQYKNNGSTLAAATELAAAVRSLPERPVPTAPTPPAPTPVPTGNYVSTCSLNGALHCVGANLRSVPRWPDNVTGHLDELTPVTPQCWTGGDEIHDDLGHSDTRWAWVTGPGGASGYVNFLFVYGGFTIPGCGPFLYGPGATADGPMTAYSTMTVRYQFRNDGWFVWHPTNMTVEVVGPNGERLDAPCASPPAGLGYQQSWTCDATIGLRGLGQYRLWPIWQDAGGNWVDGTADWGSPWVWTMAVNADPLEGVSMQVVDSGTSTPGHTHLRYTVRNASNTTITFPAVVARSTGNAMTIDTLCATNLTLAPGATRDCDTTTTFDNPGDYITQIRYQLPDGTWRDGKLFSPAVSTSVTGPPPLPSLRIVPGPSTGTPTVGNTVRGSFTVTNIGTRPTSILPTIYGMTGVGQPSGCDGVSYEPSGSPGVTLAAGAGFTCNFSVLVTGTGHADFHAHISQLNVVGAVRTCCARPDDLALGTPPVMSLDTGAAQGDQMTPVSATFGNRDMSANGFVNTDYEIKNTSSVAIGVARMDVVVVSPSGVETPVGCGYDAIHGQLPEFVAPGQTKVCAPQVHWTGPGHYTLKFQYTKYDAVNGPGAVVVGLFPSAGFDVTSTALAGNLTNSGETLTNVSAVPGGGGDAWFLAGNYSLYTQTIVNPVIEVIASDGTTTSQSCTEHGAGTFTIVNLDLFRCSQHVTFPGHGRYQVKFGYYPAPGQPWKEDLFTPLTVDVGPLTAVSHAFTAANITVGGSLVATYTVANTSSAPVTISDAAVAITDTTGYAARWACTELANGSVTVAGGATFTCSATVPFDVSGDYSITFTNGTDNDFFAADNIHLAPVIQPARDPSTISNATISSFTTSPPADLLTPQSAALPDPKSSALPDGASEYIGVAPARLTDTRPGTKTGDWTSIDPCTIHVPVAGHVGIPATATAAVLTIAVDHPAAAGWAALYPAGTTWAGIANVTFAAGEIRANSAIVQLGSGAVDVKLYGPACGAGVIIDITGAFVPATTTSGPGRFVGVDAGRVYDSRNLGPRPGAGTITTITPAQLGIPDDAQAVALNVTVTDTSSGGFVTGYPAGAPRGTVSMLNADAGNEIRAGFTIVPVSALGVSLYQYMGAHVIVDVVGYLSGSAVNGGAYVPALPNRILDTRPHPLASMQTVDIDGPAGARAIVANWTITDATTAGWVAARAHGATGMATTSTVNAAYGGDTVANLAITATTGNGVTAQVGFTTADVIVDYAGYFTA